MRKTRGHDRWKIHTHAHCAHVHATFLQPFEVMGVYHGWSVTVELQSAGGVRLMGLVQEAVHVGGQTGRGANGVIPQDVDDIVQSVQPVLHLRLNKQSQSEQQQHSPDLRVGFITH